MLTENENFTEITELINNRKSKNPKEQLMLPEQPFECDALLCRPHNMVSVSGHNHIRPLDVMSASGKFTFDSPGRSTGDVAPLTRHSNGASCSLPVEPSSGRAATLLDGLLHEPLLLTLGDGASEVRLPTLNSSVLGKQSNNCEADQQIRRPTRHFCDQRSSTLSESHGVQMQSPMSAELCSDQHSYHQQGELPPTSDQGSHPKGMQTSAVLVRKQETILSNGVPECQIAANSELTLETTKRTKLPSNSLRVLDDHRGDKPPLALDSESGGENGRQVVNESHPMIEHALTYLDSISYTDHNLREDRPVSPFEPLTGTVRNAKELSNLASHQSQYSDPPERGNLAAIPGKRTAISAVGLPKCPDAPQRELLAFITEST